MIFKLEVDLGNAAFEGKENIELSRILYKLANHMKSNPDLHEGSYGTIQYFEDLPIGEWEMME